MSKLESFSAFIHIQAFHTFILTFTRIERHHNLGIILAKRSWLGQVPSCSYFSKRVRQQNSYKTHGKSENFTTKAKTIFSLLRQGHELN